MKIKLIKSKCNNILRKLMIEPEIAGYISNYIVHCNNNNISDLDVNINSLYRINSVTYNESCSVIKTRTIDGINLAYIENNNLFIEEFGYKGKITVKKLVILILRKLRADE